MKYETISFDQARIGDQVSKHNWKNALQQDWYTISGISKSEIIISNGHNIINAQYALPNNDFIYRREVRTVAQNTVYQVAYSKKSEDYITSTEDLNKAIEMAKINSQTSNKKVNIYKFSHIGVVSPSEPTVEHFE